MKVHPQTNESLSHLGELIEGIQVAMLTSSAAACALVSRPMTPLEMDDAGCLWFFTDARVTSSEQLRTVNLSFVDIDRGVYVSISGVGTLNTDRSRIQALWTPMAKPWLPDGPESTNLALIKIQPEMAEYWDTPHSKMVRMFAMAASVVAGKPIDLGEHEKINDLSTH
jgi:general stress protein 26